MNENIIIWHWLDAPPSLQALSTNGGDEDWVAVIPSKYLGHYLGWLERIDTCLTPEVLSNHGVAGYEDCEIWIGSHA